MSVKLIQIFNHLYNFKLVTKFGNFYGLKNEKTLSSSNIQSFLLKEFPVFNMSVKLIQMFNHLYNFKLVTKFGNFYGLKNEKTEKN